MDEKHIPEQYTGKLEDLEQVYDSSSELDPVAVGKLRRKIDWHLIPLISVLYLCSFLDRVNIGKLTVGSSTYKRRERLRVLARVPVCTTRGCFFPFINRLSINRKCPGRRSLYPHRSHPKRIQLGLINLFHRVIYAGRQRKKSLRSTQLCDAECFFFFFCSPACLFVCFSEMSKRSPFDRLTWLNHGRLYTFPFLFRYHNRVD